MHNAHNSKEEVYFNRLASTLIGVVEYYLLRSTPTYNSKGKTDKNAYKSNQKKAEQLKNTLIGKTNEKTLTKRKDKVLIKKEEQMFKNYLARKNQKLNGIPSRSSNSSI